MPIKWILFVEKKEATDFDKFIKLISHEHWRVAEKISSTAANFETETGDVNVEHKLEHIFAHQEYVKRFSARLMIIFTVLSTLTAI